MLKAAGLKGSAIVRGGLSANKTQIMTTLTSVKYITQQELLDVLPRTMYGGEGKRCTRATAGTYHASGPAILIRGK